MSNAVYSICFIHHFDRIGDRINLFESYWLTVITFTTVGYGDVVPIHWSGKVIITLFLLVGILYIPPQVSEYVYVATFTLIII